MAGYRIISSDSHVIEPPDLWTTRVEPRFRDRAPRVVRSEDGGDWWYCDGIKGSPAAAGAQTGRRFEAPENLTYEEKYEDVRPGGYVPEEHVKDMDLDGVDVGIIYPTTGLNLYAVPDGELLTAMFKVYNDWLAEFCRPFPNRLQGIAMLNVDDVPSAVNELERCAGMGLAGAMITVYPPEDRSYDSPEYEPLWATAEHLAMPLSLHFLTNRVTTAQVAAADFTAAYYANIDHWVRMSLAYMIYSGVFERYPRLHVGSVEMELSWVPHFLERIDYNYTQRVHVASWYNFTENMLPSDYFHQNGFVGFQEDILGMRLRDVIGVDNLMWGSDYPHIESTFPRSRQILEEIMADCTEEERAKIAGMNAARVYDFD